MGVKQKTRTIEAMSKKELDEWLDDFNATHLGPPDEGALVKSELIAKYNKNHDSRSGQFTSGGGGGGRAVKRPPAKRTTPDKSSMSTEETAAHKETMLKLRQMMTKTSGKNKDMIRTALGINTIGETAKKYSMTEEDVASKASAIYNSVHRYRKGK